MGLDEPELTDMQNQPLKLKHINGHTITTSRTSCSKIKLDVMKRVLEAKGKNSPLLCDLKKEGNRVIGT